MNLKLRAIRKTKFLSAYVRSHISGYSGKSKFRDIRKFVIFLGYPRSGHTVIAALLDAHPNITISMEWGVLSHLKMGYRKNAIFHAIDKHSRLFTERLSNTWTGYSYRIDGLWQGKSEKIEIIGDKLAGQTSKILAEDPGLLDKLEDELGIDVKIVHVIRNPFDTISTMARRSLSKNTFGISDPDLSRFVRIYFEKAEIVKRIRNRGNNSMHDLYHEEFISHPRQELGEIFDFLEMSYETEFIEKCSSIVFESPNKSRFDIHWSKNLIHEVQQRIDQFEFMSGYRFDN